MKNTHPPRQFQFDRNVVCLSQEGDLPKDEIKALKNFGMYPQRQTGCWVVRIVLPLGVISAEQARRIADLADVYAEDVLHLSTRGNIQMYGVPLDALLKVASSLEAVGLSTFHGAGDVVRNLVACPGAAYCPSRAFDILDAARGTYEKLTADRGLDDLPRKLKIAFSGCAGNCNLPRINDIGVTAVRGVFGDQTREGFAITVGGGHGKHPTLAKPLFEFVPREQIAEVCRAIAVVFRERGNRKSRSSARFKYLVDELGISEIRALVEDSLDRMGESAEDLRLSAVLEFRSPLPHSTRGAVPMGAGDRFVQRIRVPKGEIRTDAFRRAANVSEKWGDGLLRATFKQNLEIYGVLSENLKALRTGIASLALGTEGFCGLSDIVTCAAGRACSMGREGTRALADDILRIVDDKVFDDIRPYAMIQVAGCANACAPVRTADVGFLGVKIPSPFGVVDGFEITLGGSPFELGQRAGKYLRRDVERIVETLLGRFRALRLSDEKLSKTVQRIGLGPFVGAISMYRIDVANLNETKADPSENRI